MDGQSRAPSGPMSVVGGWRYDENGWWSCLGHGIELLCFQFQFEGTTPPDLDGPSVIDGDFYANVAFNNSEIPLLQKVLEVSTGLRVRLGMGAETQCSMLEEVVKMADPMPLLHHLEIEAIGVNGVCNSILTGMRSGKFSRLKHIKWGDSYRSAEPREADIRSLAELVRAGTFPVLSGLSVWFGDCFGSCSKTTVVLLITSLEHIGGLLSLHLTGHPMKNRHHDLIRIMRSGHLHSLEELDLSSTYMGDNECELYEEAIKVGRIGALRTLIVRNNSIGGEGARALMGALVSTLQEQNSQSLRKLAFDGNRIGDKGALAVADALRKEEFESLQELNIGSNNIGEEGAQAVADALGKGKFRSLQKLAFDGNSIGNDGALALADALREGKFESLQELDVGSNGIGEEGARALADALRGGNFKLLQVLAVNGNSIGDQGAHVLADAFREGNFQSLRVLAVNGNKIGDQGAQVLAEALREGNFQSLQELALNENSIGSKGAENLAYALREGKFQGLQKLSVSGNNMGGKGARALADALRKGNFQSLQELHVDENSIGNEGAQALADALREGKFQSLQKLSVKRNKIGGKGVQALANALWEGKFKSLQKFSMSGNKIGSKGAQALAEALLEGKIHSLQKLSISDNDIGGKGTQALAKTLREGKFEFLQKLSLSGNNIGFSGPKALADALQKGNFPSLRKLSISNNSISLAAEEEALADAFREGKFKSLQKLDVSDNSMSGKALASALQEGKFQSLQILDVSGNIPLSAKALADALLEGKCPSLRMLHMQGNYIQDGGIRALADTLRKENFSSLQMLSFKNNHIGSKGARALGEALREGNLQSLQTLDISFNSIGGKGARVLVEALCAGNCKSLQTLDIRGDRDFITSKDGKAILSAFESNVLLVVDVKLEWSKLWLGNPELVQSFGCQMAALKERNKRNAGIMVALGREQVAATFAKVSLCGYPKVGKTTLRKTLQRTFWKSIITLEKLRKTEKRTRGIQTSRLICKRSGKEPMTLVTWDLAGQEEYHLIHNSFFSGSTFAEGSITTFVVMCNASQDKERLDYWLRFINSSCVRSFSGQNCRPVLVVLNCIKGQLPDQRSMEKWREFLEDRKKSFHYLEIQETPFVLDVRRWKCVQEFKRNLMNRSIDMLEKQPSVPGICVSIQHNLNVWSREQEQFPVLAWKEFLEKVKMLQSDTIWSEKKIEAAAKYLNQAGIIIFVDVPKCKLIVPDPNTFCNRVLGDMFLVRGHHGEHLFREELDKFTGSIGFEKFENFFKRYLSKKHDYMELIQIMMHLGICYKGSKGNLIFPALIAEESAQPECWKKAPAGGYEKQQWVMGFSIEHQQDDTSIAPMALWNRFQVDLAQSPEYAWEDHNGFVMRKNFMAFTLRQMVVLIQVYKPSPGSFTFDAIDIFVKPSSSVSEDAERKVEMHMRRVLQLDLASELVGTLLKVWDKTCPGVKYVQRVIWPWQAENVSYTPDTHVERKRNVEVSKVQEWVKEGGLQYSMQNWKVGSREVTAGQLLSRKDTVNLLESVKLSNKRVEPTVNEAEALVRDVTRSERDRSVTDLLGESVEDNMQEERDTSVTDLPGEIIEDNMQGAGSSLIAVESPATGSHDKVLMTLINKHHVSQWKHMDEHMEKLHASLEKHHDSLKRMLNDVKNDFSTELAKQSRLLSKIQDVARIFLEKEESSCPRLICLGEMESGRWISIKKAISPNSRFRVHFFCEAGYDKYLPHAVKGQEGIEIVKMKEWAKAVAPWLKVSLTILSATAKVAVNVAAPGAGLAISSFQDWEQISKLADGLALGTAFAQNELDALTGKGCGAEVGGSRDQPLKLYGQSKRAMTHYLEKELTDADKRKKLGLQRVQLYESNGAFRNVAWICNECHSTYKDAGRAIDI